MEVDYIRRTWGNLLYTVNRAATPADFDSFVFNVPADSRLPGSGNYSLKIVDTSGGANSGAEVQNLSAAGVTLRFALRFETLPAASLTQLMVVSTATWRTE